MRILIFGGDGMIGHQLYQSWADKYEVMVTLKGTLDHYRHADFYNVNNAYPEVDALDMAAVDNVLKTYRPDAVINAIGITKQLAQPGNLKELIQINALFPHILLELCDRYQSRLVQLSTDCVFSGDKGDYTEDDNSDARDAYGRTKYLGEVDADHAVTLRKSTIGLELNNPHGLVEWFLSQKGVVHGYKNAIYSGLISSELARVIENILIIYTDIHGVWNVASQPISKYDVLAGLSDRLGRQDIEILPDTDFVCDRSLNGEKFQNATGYVAPDWDLMLDTLADQIQSRERSLTRSI